MGIIAMKQGNQIEGILKATASSQKVGAVSRSLQMGSIKRKGGQVFTTQDGYSIRGMEGMPTQAFINLLNKDNNNVISVNYKDGVEGNDLISKTEQPLWEIDKSNGSFNIKRNF